MFFYYYGVTCVVVVYLSLQNNSVFDLMTCIDLVVINGIINKMVHNTCFYVYTYLFCNNIYIM